MKHEAIQTFKNAWQPEEPPAPWHTGLADIPTGVWQRPRPGQASASERAPVRASELDVLSSIVDEGRVSGVVPAHRGPAAPSSVRAGALLETQRSTSRRKQKQPVSRIDKPGKSRDDTDPHCEIISIYSVPPLPAPRSAPEDDDEFVPVRSDWFEEVAADPDSAEPIVLGPVALALVAAVAPVAAVALVAAADPVAADFEPLRRRGSRRVKATLGLIAAAALTWIVLQLASTSEAPPVAGSVANSARHSAVPVPPPMPTLPLAPSLTADAITNGSPALEKRPHDRE